MPYKDLEKQKACQHQYYLDNKKLYNEKRTNSRKNIKKWFLEFTKDNKCFFCGETERCCFDYHHKDPKQKDRTISELIQKYSNKEKIIEEYNKCICVCSNCHRKIHKGIIIVP